MCTQNGCSPATFLIEKERRNTWLDPRVSWTSSPKIDEVVDVNFLYQASKSQKRDFRDVPGDIKCYSNRNVKFENFMHSEWREERFFKDIVGDKMRLCFWSIASFWGRGVGETKKDDLAYIHLTRYNFMHERVRRYQQSIPGNLTNR